MSRRAAVITHGCRANLAEADALAMLAPPGSTVVNSCAVTAAAVRDARTAVRRALRSGPAYLTGCAASAMPERFADLGVALVPAAAKLLPASWGGGGADAALPAVARRSRGFVAIQDGCDHRCTFCITRIARGPSRSQPADAVVERVAALARAGVAEVVLTGIDTSGYGQDLPGRPRLGQLVRRILADVPGLPRLRLSSLDAAEADDALVAAFKNPRLMPHVHLSLQHGDDAVLKRMARRHRRADALALVAALRAVRPDMAIGADLIAGFPGETEEAHAQALSLIDAAGLDHVHVFPFSPRPGTHAATLPQLSPSCIRARAAQLRAAAAARHRALLAAFVGRPLATVSEGEKGIAPQGFAVHYAVPRPRGRIITLVPSALAGDRLCE